MMLTDSYHDSVGSSEESCASSSESAAKEAMVRRDLVHSLRMGVLIVLLLVAAVSVFAAYGTASKVEENEFRSAFEAKAYKVHEVIHSTEMQQKKVLKALTNQVTSYSMTIESLWPLVVLPNVDTLLTTYKELGRFSGIFFSPLIEPQQQVEWKALCEENLGGWLPGALTSGNQTAAFCDTALSSSDKEVWLPLWQYSPVVNSLPGASIFEHLRFSLNKTIISTSISYPDDGTALNGFMNKILSLSESYESGEPISIFTSPVFTSFDEGAQASAVVVAPFALRDYLDNILPDSTQGLVCVVTNTLNEAFTFEINDGVALYLGPGDQHNPVYDSYAFDSHKFGHNKNDDAIKTFFVTIYPSISFETQHKTRTPVVNAIFMFALFAFTTLVFLVYDCCVERRQRHITTKVNTATAVVSSLFPEAVGQQLLREAGEMKRRDSGLEDQTQGAKEAIADFFPGKLTTITFQC